MAINLFVAIAVCIPVLFFGESWSVTSTEISRYEKMFTKKEYEAYGELSHVMQVENAIHCAAACLALSNCFVWALKQENGFRYCHIIKEIEEIREKGSGSYNLYFDSDGYHKYKKYTRYRSKWIKLTTVPMTFADAKLFCAQQEAEMFLPVDQQDIDVMVETMIAGGLSYMWFPITDLSGTLEWTNGSEVSITDPVPWEDNTYGYKSPSNSVANCAQVNSNTKVIIYWCGYEDAGVVCRSKLDTN